MLPLSGAWTPKIVIENMQRPMISDISASFSCPKPAPPSFGSRNAPHRPRSFTLLLEVRLHHRPLIAGQFAHHRLERDEFASR